MPPFLKRKCPNCSYSNVYDLAELRRENMVVYKDPGPQTLPREREYQVTCRNCGQEFIVIEKAEP